MKVYMVTYGRPIGLKPVIYYYRPNVEHDIPGHACHPWCGEVQEFESEFEARKHFKECYPQQYDDLKVIK